VAIRLKTPQQIESMCRAGAIVRQVLDRLGEMIAPGVTTLELDQEAEKLCKAAGAECLFKGVPGMRGAGPFPGSICASVNEQVVHGIPSDRKILDGDIVSVDFGVKLDGWCGDSAETYAVGEIDASTQDLIDVTREVLALAIEMCEPGQKWSCIAKAMQQYVQTRHMSVVEEFVGHGIGKDMHEDPKVPNFPSRELKSRDIILREGMVLAIEPMVNLGSPGVKAEPDGWTIRTKDGKPSAHFEHTVAIVAGGVKVLTSGCD